MRDSTLACQQQVRSEAAATRVGLASPPSYAILGAITLFAFAVRVYQLDHQSLWFDEGFAAYAALRPSVLDLLQFLVREDVHPPLHYLILQAWVRFAGHSEFALRYVSVIAGTLSIPLIARLGACLFDKRLGYLAAALLAVSPFHIWYSQEARMYALVCLLAIASVSLYLKCQSGAGWKTVLAYVAISAALLLSHYYGLFVLLFENMAFLAALVIGRQRSLSLRKWLAIQGLIAGLCSPWLFGFASQVQRGTLGPQGFVALWSMLQKVSIAFSVGDEPAPVPYLSQVIGAPASSIGPLHWVFLLVLLLGVGLGLWRATRWRRQTRTRSRRPWPIRVSFLPDGKSPIGGCGSGVAFTLFYLANAPVAALLVTVALSKNIRAESDKYYMVIFPAYLLLLAYSICSLARHSRASGLLVGGLLFAVLFVATAGQAVARQKEEYRSVASYVMKRELPNEVIVLNPGYLHFVFDLYYHGVLQWRSAESGDEGAVDASLESTTAGYEGAWLIVRRDEAIDPKSIVKAWFDERGLLLDEQWFVGPECYITPLSPAPISGFLLCPTRSTPYSPARSG